jgi:hypothetical protein
MEECFGLFGVWTRGEKTCSKGAFVSALKKKIDFVLKESRDFFYRDFKKNLKLFLFAYYP